MIFRHTWAEVDLDAIFDNVKHFKQHLAEGKELMATVKADAYGHGSIPVARTALRAGATWLAVALLEEGIELREAGIEAPILVMGYVPVQHVPLAQRYRLRITVPDYTYFKALIPHLSHSTSPLQFHLKLDTGMGRLGLFHPTELQQVIDEYQRLRTGSPDTPLIWEGAYSHLATADEHEPHYENYLIQQIERFDQQIERIKASGLHLTMIHLANSAALMRRRIGRYSNAARLGISLYGLLPSAWMDEVIPFNIVPAFSLHSRLSQVKQLPPETGISYGSTYRTQSDEWIGTVPIGYADGYARLLSNKAEVLIQGRRYPVVGRVCMDQLMVKLDRPLSRDEQVTLIGQQGEERISADELAQLIGTINYEIPCQISKRVPRLYTASYAELADLVTKNHHLV